MIYAVTIVSKIKKNDQYVFPDGDVDNKDFDPDLHKFKFHIFTATPLMTGLTIPQTEVSGLVLCSRLMSKAVSLYDGGFSSVSCLGDSTCIISALEKNATAFNSFMHTRLAEIFNL